jgi:methyl-accepting chemotaxis protein WspA
MPVARFRDIPIKSKLYGLVAFTTLSFAAVLALAGYLLAEYRVNGPVYASIIQHKDLINDLSPPSLLLTQPYITLQELETVTDPAEVKSLLSRFRELEQRYRDAQGRWLTELPPGNSFREDIEKKLSLYSDDIFQVAREQCIPLILKGGADRERASQLLREKITPQYREQRQAVAELARKAEQELRRLEEDARADTRFWGQVLLAVSVASVVALGLVGVWLARNIVGSTRTLIGRVNEMAGGASDLTARVAVDSKDEIGELATGINGMIAKIQSVVQKVRESSIQLLSTASEIAATSRQQEATMQGLGSSTTEIAAAVREISATGKELSGTMNEVNERAGQAASLATAGRTRLAGMEETMQQLVGSTASISAKLAAIREKADNINSVVTTITKVADQTNLLSINAAIEAEKAGEYGRGFLVVAREIRRLADQTAVATLDIDNIVRHMHDAVTAGVMQMDKFSEEVRTGVARIAEINTQTGQIIEEVHGLTSRFQQVNEGMRNQALGAQQINEAMVQVSNGTQQTAASLEEFNRATAHLRGSVELLNQEIAQFTT